ncbi:MAG TPA: hypothetical protein VKB80_10970 [Kofleriaceae bacterium]|nr:hypothetical protein [Kofleriaceae bacterium]
MRRPALALTTLLAVACSGGPAGDTDGRADGEGNAIGNPEGYAVHVLSGEFLSARDVAINDRSIDTSTIEAIDDSVAAILDGAGALVDWHLQLRPLTEPRTQPASGSR